jgi:hypothetical protein
MSALIKDGTDGIMKTLGFARSKAVRQSRLEAIKDPAKYEADRNAKLDVVETDIKAFYKAAAEKYAASGFDTDSAKEQARKESAMIAKLKIDQVNIDYPPLSGETMKASAPRWAANMDPYTDSKAAPRSRARAKAPAARKKDPARVKAGKKAAATRRANAKK